MASISNNFVDKLPPAMKSHLLSFAEPVAMPIRTSLYSPGRPPRHLHFVTSGIASVVTSMSNGDGIEVGLVGREGIPEAIYLLGPIAGVNECFIQVPATALRVDFRRFQEDLFCHESVRALIFQQIQYTNMLTGQIAACNRLHDVEERLARWLLMVADRVGSPHFPLTQEFLAEMIGSRRSTVTLTAGVLKRAGFIDYHRGEVEIIDRQGLEDAACECYAITQRLFSELRA